MTVARDRESEASTTTTRTAERGLDSINFLIASIQTGFGPFVAVYLTTQGWTQSAIGFALSLGTIAAMASQVPAGALVDVTRRKSLVAAFSIFVFTGSALLFATHPLPLFIYLAEILHSFASCVLGPAIAAISLMVVSRAALSRRLGRNVRYASLGNGLGAALMGSCGYFVSNRGVFFLTALLTVPALLALLPLARFEERPDAVRTRQPISRSSMRQVLSNRTLLIFAAAAMSFTLANAAMLPLASIELTKRSAAASSLLIAVCVVLPQAIVALLSPFIGTLAEIRGRRIVLLLGFSMLPLRGICFALLTAPALIVAVQALDGVAAAAFGIMMPLVCADVAGRSGRFNLALGFVGFANGIGATVGTALAGVIAERFGDQLAFGALGAIGAAATLLVALAMPETRLAT